MKLTRQYLKQNAEAMIAFADGKPIQFQTEEGFAWIDYQHPEEMPAFTCYRFRVKPEPKMRSWSGPDDVPLNCWIQLKNGEFAKTWIAKPIAIFPDGISLACKNDVTLYTWDEIRILQMEYTTDFESWKRCEVTE